MVLIFLAVVSGQIDLLADLIDALFSFFLKISFVARNWISGLDTMTDEPPSYDSSRPSRPTINFPIIRELHGKRVVLGNIPVASLVNGVQPLRVHDDNNSWHKWYGNRSAEHD